MKKIIVYIICCFGCLSVFSSYAQQSGQAYASLSIQRNSVYAEILGNSAIFSVSYERIVPLGQKTGLGFRVGMGTAGSFDTTNSDLAYTGLGEINFLFGKSKSFLETGLGYTATLNTPEHWISIRLGYRYQAPKGFLFRIAPMYIYNFEVLNGNDDVFDGFWIGASIGYSF